MHKLIILFILAATLTGCAYYHGPLATLPPIKEGGAAELIVIRELAFASGGGSMVITIDNLDVFALENGAYITFQVNPGEHLIGVSLDFGNHARTGQHKDSFLQLTVSAGEKRYLLLTPHPAGGWYPYASITGLSPSDGEAMLKVSKPAKQP